MTAALNWLSVPGSVAVAREVFEVLNDAAEDCVCEWSPRVCLNRDAMQVTAADYRLPDGIFL